MKAALKLLAVIWLCAAGCAHTAPVHSERHEAFDKILAQASGVGTGRYPVVHRRLDREVPFLEPDAIDPSTVDSVIIVLGTRPLDETTPSVDMIARVLKGIDLLKDRPGAIMVMTGGRTAGQISEARMMGMIAWARGVDPQRIVLEENSTNTLENAEYCARLLSKLNGKRIFLVTRNEHMARAAAMFREYPVFVRLKPPVDCGITFPEIIAQMEQYLQRHSSPDVEERLNEFRRKAAVAHR